MTKDGPPIPPLVYVLALAQFAAPFMFSGVGVALPAMGRELGASGVELGLIETLYPRGSQRFPLACGAFC